MKREKGLGKPTCVSYSSVFQDANGQGTFVQSDGKESIPYMYLIQNNESVKNLYAPISQRCIAYFNNEDIAFWHLGKATHNHVPNHVLSSQVSCLNHLFAIRNDDTTVASVAQALIGDFAIVKGVKPLLCDKVNPQYIAFEVVSHTDHLNEQDNSPILNRGALCTSIDAVILAQTNK